MTPSLRRWHLWGLVVLVWALGGCASLTPPSAARMAAFTGPTAERADPWERFNRAMYSFNETIDDALVKPAAVAYRTVVPRLVRTGVNNVLGNFFDAWSTANLALQLKLQPALEMGMRVATNTVFGMFGILDVADELGLERRSTEDFGQTLGRWGVPAGPYLVLPLIGPSTVRDGVARVVDNKYSPSHLGWHELRDRNGVTALQVLSARVSLLTATNLLDDIALDKYIFVRDAYLARRRSLIYDGDPPDEPAPK